MGAYVFMGHFRTQSYLREPQSLTYGNAPGVSGTGSKRTFTAPQQFGRKGSVWTFSLSCTIGGFR